MPTETRMVHPGPDGRSVRTTAGAVLRPPGDWVLVPPGDPGLTRRVKAAGPTWTVQEKKGRKIFSHGVWARGEVVRSVKEQLAAERAMPQYAKKREADARRRNEAQAEYVAAFRQTILQFLRFAPRHSNIAAKLARAVTDHATPVGSGTVARTERIPIEQRAESAVIAWMRHQTTAYEQMPIPRIKGKRREVRRRLAARSNQVLEAYRADRDVDVEICLLQRALSLPSSPSPEALEQNHLKRSV